MIGEVRNHGELTAADGLKEKALLQECFRGGLKSPGIVQEGIYEATILASLRRAWAWDGFLERHIGGVLKVSSSSPGRFERAPATGSRVEKGQQISFARKFRGRRAAILRRASSP